MAHFYGTVQGGRGKGTRCGAKNSGMLATAAGWNLGGVVRMACLGAYGKNERDAVQIEIDGGSGKSHNYGHVNAARIDGEVAVTHLSPELLDRMTDEAWATLIEYVSPRVVQKLRVLVFANADKLQEAA